MAITKRVVKIIKSRHCLLLNCMKGGMKGWMREDVKGIKNCFAGQLDWDNRLTDLQRSDGLPHRFIRDIVSEVPGQGP